MLLTVSAPCVGALTSIRSGTLLTTTTSAMHVGKGGKIKRLLNQVPQMLTSQEFMGQKSKIFCLGFDFVQRLKS